MKDQLFQKPLDPSQKFKFDESVAAVFDDMLERSIPFYREVQRLTGELAQTFYQPQSRIYDLGSSTGILLHYLAHLLAERSPYLVGVDSSPAMIERSQERLQRLPETVALELHCADILKIAVTQASVVVINYTLQFLPSEQRPSLLRRMQEGLLPGGILILCEKVASADERIHELQQTYYEDFKKRNGYSQTEIAQKRKALEQVLIPQTWQHNLQMLHEAGFQSTEILFKWYNFVALLGVKSDVPLP